MLSADREQRVIRLLAETDPMEVRLAKFLLLALDGRRAPGGRRVPLEFGFNQSELAQLLGASRPKVNVVLGGLEHANVIRWTSDRLFCDPDKLAQVAEETLRIARSMG